MRNFEDLQIAVAGTGYVGLSIATLLSQHHKVTAVDVIPEKVEKINNRISPIQDEYIEKYFVEKDLNLTATLDGVSAYKDADFVVIAAPTNYDPDRNFFDTHHIEDVIDLVLSVNPEATMVIKSTIPVGYCRSLYVKYAQKFAELGPLSDGRRREFRLLFLRSFFVRARRLKITCTRAELLLATQRFFLQSRTKSGMKRMPLSKLSAILMQRNMQRPLLLFFRKVPLRKILTLFLWA